MKLKGIFILVACAALVSGCDRYRVTLNDRLVSEPPPLLKGFEIADIALDTCIHQAITDRAIRRVNELETLICSHAGISSLDGIEFFSNLQTINLANNALTSIEPLLFLGGLQSVNLENNPALNCDHVNKLADQLPQTGTFVYPEHCAAQQ